MFFGTGGGDRSVGRSFSDERQHQAPSIKVPHIRRVGRNHLIKERLQLVQVLWSNPSVSQLLIGSHAAIILLADSLSLYSYYKTFKKIHFFQSPFRSGGWRAADEFRWTLTPTVSSTAETVTSSCTHTGRARSSTPGRHPAPSIPSHTICTMCPSVDACAAGLYASCVQAILSCPPLLRPPGREPAAPWTS